MNNMADTKVILKDIRKLIDEQNFKDAQERCKDLLRKDKQNYLGLVLLGKSLQDSDQAALAYQKAISIKPDQLLAWQGLSSFYERREDDASRIKLVTVYEELLKLQLDEDKALDILRKLGALGCLLKSNDIISIFLRFISSNLGKEKLLSVARQQVLEVLKCNVICKEEDILPVLSTLDEIYIQNPSESIELLYGKIILQKPNFVHSIDEITNLPFFSKNVILKDWLCKHLCTKFVESNSFNDLNIENYIDKITLGVENSKYPKLLQSMVFYNNCQYLESYKTCVPLINYQQADRTEVVFVINCTNMIKKWPLTEKLALNFLPKTNDESLIFFLQKCLLLSLLKQKKWRKSAEIANKINLDNFNSNELASVAECYIELGENVDHIISKIKSNDLCIQLQALQLLKENKFSETVTLLENAEESPLILFYLGRSYWELKEYSKCHVTLLKAAKNSPDNADVFLYLGHYYHHYVQDLTKAKKCYEKSYSLNNIDSSIAKNLSEIYIKLKMVDADFDLLQSIEKNLEIDDVWVNFRLGLHFLRKKEWENAIVNFRNVIKRNSKDTTAFECLADAYYARGSFTSALRAYSKVMSLDSNKIPHCLTRTGYIHSVLTEYDEAISTFEKVLKIDSNCFLALKGIAETWMRVAKNKLSAKLFGSARDCAQNAVNYITGALSKQKKYLCLWKLLGDTLMFVTKLPKKYRFVFIKKAFDDTNEEIIKAEASNIYSQAITCYSFIAKQKHQNSSHDLASAYLECFIETRNVVNCNIAFRLALSCIKSRPSHWQNWNLLGKIFVFINKYHLAQHCFIKALMVTRKWSVAKIWCNLGSLYLKLKLYKTSNYCFWRGQSTLPSHPHSWIGQGLIAEAIREDEAMDLFRHASRLGYHPESALGYADWVCRILKKNNDNDNFDLKYVIEGLYAISYSIDLVEWYSTYEPDDACSSTILGILQERSGLLNGALKSYIKALQLAPESKKNIALLNLGRILVRTGQFDEAIKVYKSITEASLNSTSGLALALYKNGLFEESYTAYDTALHWLSDGDEEKADLLVAMAGIIYTYKGADDAKTLLFHSIQISQNKPTANSLLSICSLGLIHSDQSLSKLALSELKKYERDSNFGFDIGFLKSYIFACEENTDKAIKILSDSLHDHPSNAPLWYCMAQYCLRTSDLKERLASSCAQRALCSSRQCDSKCEPAKMIATASVAEHLSGNTHKALLMAKEGLHMYPYQAEIWAALLFSLLPHESWLERKDWLLAAAGHMRRNLDISRPLSKWVGFLEKNLIK